MIMIKLPLKLGSELLHKLPIVETRPINVCTAHVMTAPHLWFLAFLESCYKTLSQEQK